MIASSFEMVISPAHGVNISFSEFVATCNDVSAFMKVSSLVLVSVSTGNLSE